MKIVSDVTFYWAIIAVVTVPASGWILFDIVRMRRFFRRPLAERTHDELFGMTMGIIMGLSGLGGVVKHFAGW